MLIKFKETLGKDNQIFYKTKFEEMLIIFANQIMILIEIWKFWIIFMKIVIIIIIHEKESILIVYNL